MSKKEDCFLASIAIFVICALLAVGYFARVVIEGVAK